MQITGAFLAAHAKVADDKTLTVSGGVVSWVGLTSVTNDGDTTVHSGLVHLVTLMQAGPDDHQTPYRMTVELVIDGEVRGSFVGEIPADAHSGENRFWVTPIALSLAGHVGVDAAAQSLIVNVDKPGRIIFVNSIEGGGSVSIPVEVRPAT